jgi:segregation and condensation protein B
MDLEDPTSDIDPDDRPGPRPGVDRRVLESDGVTLSPALEPGGATLSPALEPHVTGAPGRVGPAPVEEGDAPSPPEPLPPWSELSVARRQSIIEALIFASEQPLTIKDMRELLGVPKSELVGLIAKIREDLAHHQRGIVLEDVAGGYVFRTRVELAPWLRALVKTRPPRLSRAALECLAIVAYRQPVTRAEVEEVRGVESGSILRALLEKRLVRILGRKEDIGRPMIYGTTREFLQMFGLKDLTALPTLRDLSALMGKAQGPAPGGEEEGALDLPAAPSVAGQLVPIAPLAQRSPAGPSGRADDGAVTAGTGATSGRADDGAVTAGAGAASGRVDDGAVTAGTGAADVAAVTGRPGLEPTEE